MARKHVIKAYRRDPDGVTIFLHGADPVVPRVRRVQGEIEHRRLGPSGRLNHIDRGPTRPLGVLPQHLGIRGIGPLLLAGIRRAMDGRQAISTADLLTSINADEELPFGAWNEGRGIEARRLARLLKPYGIKPKSIRVGDGTPKGYALEDLQDAFARYLPEPQQAQHPQQAQEVERRAAHQSGDVADVADVADVSNMGAGDVEEEELASEDLERELERLRAEFDFDGNVSA